MHRQEALRAEALKSISLYTRIPKTRARVLPGEKSDFVKPLTSREFGFLKSTARTDRNPRWDEKKMQARDAEVLIEKSIGEELADGHVVVIDANAKREVVGIRMNKGGIDVIHINRTSGASQLRHFEDPELSASFTEDGKEFRLAIDDFVFASSGTLRPAGFNIVSSSSRVILSRRDWVGSPSQSYEYLKPEGTAWVVSIAKTRRKR